MRDIVIGRTSEELKSFGKKGAVLLGKQYVKMGQTYSLSNNVYLDVTGSHVMFICGKRGGGKSYTMGVIAEGLSEIKEEDVKSKISIILVDTMGVYWTMKYPNKRDELLLKGWGFDPKSVDVNIFTPFFYYNKYKEQGIPTDYPFAIKPSEMGGKDWIKTFQLGENSPEAILIERSILDITKIQDSYTIDDIIGVVKNDNKSELRTKNAVENLFLRAKGWGVFSEEDDAGYSLRDIAKGGTISVLDLSCYSTMPAGSKIKSMVLGILAQNLFIYRMQVRKEEELSEIKKSTSFFQRDGEEEKSNKMPIVWLVIDEAHEFLPKDKEVMATDALVTIMREGRQPGISLILATQQPGKIHSDVMTQSDIVLSHRITAKLDTQALGLLTQSYMTGSLDRYVNEMPAEKGSAIIFDDNNERVFPIRVRPRFSWHGGTSAAALEEKKKDFDLD